MRALAFLLLAVSAVQASFWMADIPHRGVASFNPDKSYAIFRNVRAFGAVGDGVTDDTAAINAAISFGNRCIGYQCVGTTTTPAVVYFPPGTYLVTNSIIVHYYTQIIGDPNDMPVIKGAASFRSTTMGLLESNPYMDNGKLNFISTNVFFRQVRNLMFDTTAIPGPAIAVHWPSSQATSIQNCVFKLSIRPGDTHTGIFMEEGSGGLLSDLVFVGGQYGAQFGNQQYTMRNLTFFGAQTAILQIWNWGWTYKSINIIDCQVGINMSATHVGSATLIDSEFINVEVALVTGRSLDNSTGQGSLVVENVEYMNVPIVLQGADGQPLLLGDSSGMVWDWGYVAGNIYVPEGPYHFNGRDSLFFYQPADLKRGNLYYERSKPQYEDYPPSAFISARQQGAAGDGITDDTNALNQLFLLASINNLTSVAFLDAGYYRVSDTVYIPAGARIVGEALSAVIMASGPKFSDINNPHPVVMIGTPGEAGYIEMSDVIVSTQGATAGAVLIQYNLKTPAANSYYGGSLPSGLWDVHTRIGGFAGSELQVAECPITPKQVNQVDPACIAAHTSMHITQSAENLYMENNWLWVADHDIEDLNMTRITVFAGRGLLIEASRVWLVGTSVEHHTLYQYQLVNASDIWMGQIQTETPYYQPNPPAPYPFVERNLALWDPDFDLDCQGDSGLPGNPPCAMAWGLRVLSSENVVVFGAGLYSFFNNYETNCSTRDMGENCQGRIFSVGSANGGEPGAMTVEVYNLNTVGTVSMVTREGADVAYWKDNFANFASTLAVFRF